MQEIISQFQQTSWIEWAGTVTGLLAVLLSIREKVLAWPLFILCYGFYTYLSVQASLPAAMILNLIFIPISIYGWIQWNRSTNEQEDTNRIHSVSPKTIWILLGVSIVLTLLLGVINQLAVKGALPYLDAFATVISLVAQWMLSRKMAENWIAWIIADVAFAILWGLQGYWMTVIMFVVFTGLAVSGWIAWRKESQKHA